MGWHPPSSGTIRTSGVTLARRSISRWNDGGANYTTQLKSRFHFSCLLAPLPRGEAYCVYSGVLGPARRVGGSRFGLLRGRSRLSQYFVVHLTHQGLLVLLLVQLNIFSFPSFYRFVRSRLKQKNKKSDTNLSSARVICTTVVLPGRVRFGGFAFFCRKRERQNS